MSACKNHNNLSALLLIRLWLLLNFYNASLTTRECTGASPLTTPAFWSIVTVFSMTVGSTFDTSLTCSTVLSQSRASWAVYPKFTAIYSIPSSICEWKYSIPLVTPLRNPASRGSANPFADVRLSWAVINQDGHLQLASEYRGRTEYRYRQCDEDGQNRNVSWSWSIPT